MFTNIQPVLLPLTEIGEFHFVDGKPSNVNPHPILNMGMEPTKMQKRAMELRQQKELRKMLMQQQLAAGGGQLMGQVLPGGAIVVDGQIVGQDSLGVGTSFGQQLMGDGNQDQGSDGKWQWHVWGWGRLSVSGGTIFFVGDIEGTKCVSEGIKLKKFAENGQFLPFFLLTWGGGSGAEPLSGGNAPLDAATAFSADVPYVSLTKSVW